MKSLHDILTMKKNDLAIHPITTLDEINQIPALESAIWGKDISLAVPNHILLTVAKNGGLVSGAYIDEKLVGFTLGWLGTTKMAGPGLAAQHLKLVSHMNGVLPEYRDQKIGLHLKLAQREWALARGLALITWTFDPLESRNAYLNVHLLGATCQTYLRDIYGELSDGLNSGIATDRFRVDWSIDSKHVRERLVQRPKSRTLADLDAPLLNPAAWLSEKHPHPAERIASPASKRVLVEIPADMQAIRQDDLALGFAWRQHTRTIFESLFAAGYQVNDFIYERDTATPRSFYLLDKQWNTDEN
jgi:predicted GNAT superfamily acetyltransferase